MELTNTQLDNFVDRIKLNRDKMSGYKVQIDNLKEKLKDKIKNDNRTGLKVTKFIISGSWKKHTILRHTGDKPVDLDLILYVEGDDNIKNDLKKLHDFVVEYLSEIYPTKDIEKDADAEGFTKSIKITFSSSGLVVDIVPVVPVTNPKDYVWQPQRGGGGKYLTSINGQLDFARERKQNNSSYTAIVRTIKWWRNYKELYPTVDEPGLSSFTIELIVAYLDIVKGVEQDIEEGVIRFFQFLSNSSFPEITFSDAINKIPQTYDGPVYIADPTNNENNSVKKMNTEKWKEIVKEANEAFESLNIAQSKNYEGNTLDEWKTVFGPSYSIEEVS